MYNKDYIFKISLILIGICVLLILDSCKRKEEEPKYCYMPQEFKDYTVFTPGDYWVYRSNSGEKDSNLLFSQNLREVRSDDIISILLSQLYIRNNTDTFLVSGEQIGNNCLYIYFNKYGCAKFFYPITKNDYVSSQYVVKCVDVIDTLNLNGNIFFNVIVIDYSNNIESCEFIKKYYFARNIGIIKKELFDGTIWEIENYSVHQ